MKITLVGSWDSHLSYVGTVVSLHGAADRVFASVDTGEPCGNGRIILGMDVRNPAYTLFTIETAPHDFQI